MTNVDVRQGAHREGVPISGRPDVPLTVPGAPAASSTAPPTTRTTTRVEQVRDVTRDLYRVNPAIAWDYVGDLADAADEATRRAQHDLDAGWLTAERLVAVAREWHDMHAAALAAFEAAGGGK